MVSREAITSNNLYKEIREYFLKIECCKQAGAELGQAQLKLGLDCTLIKVCCHQHDFNKKFLARSLVSFCSLSKPTLHFTPLKSGFEHLSYA